MSKIASQSAAIDSVWVLRHPTNLLAKTWKADGTIKPFDDGKFFVGKTRQINNIHELSALLYKLETDPNACIIRGEYVGHDEAARKDPDTKPGKVRRTKAVHNDIPHHWLMVDVDNYTTDVDLMLDPVGAMGEFVETSLPGCFHGTSFHWQLSSSAGHPSKDPGILKAHIWFWLNTPYMSCQLREWAIADGYKGDKALLDTIQAHYTATPVFEEGVTKPQGVRSGFVSGEWGDTVNLIIPDEIIKAAGDGTAPASRQQKLADALSSDPVVNLLYEKGMVKSQRTDDGLNIVCPRESEHSSGAGAESSTIYYPAWTKGYRDGNFKCMHEHCRGLAISVFLDALGYDDFDNVFDDLTGERKAPEAQFLCTDQANAKRIADTFGKSLIFIAGRPYSYDGARYKYGEEDAFCKAMNLSKIIKAEGDGYRSKKTKNSDEKKKNAELADALDKWAARSEMGQTISAALNLAKKIMSVDASMVDANPNLCNFLNCTVDLSTGRVRPHNPADLITKISPVEYHPDAKCPAWDCAVGQIMLEHNTTDPEKVRFLQRWFGYALTGLTREQVFTVHYGGGRNGKSTIIETVMGIMGDYAAAAAPGLMLSSKSQRHPTEIADLFGKRLVTASETDEGGVLREDFIKQATGGDTLKARHMGKDFFDFTATHKLQLMTNHKPGVKGQDEGIWRRILFIAYLAKFGTPEEVASGNANFVRDNTLSDRLAAEKEGILAWMVRGAVDWYQSGLGVPRSILDDSRQYQKEQDRVLQFVEEVCELNQDYTCYLTAGADNGIFPAYGRWCKHGGFFPLQKNNFVERLAMCVPHFKKTDSKIPTGDGSVGRRSVVVLHGLRFINEWEL